MVMATGARRTAAVVASGALALGAVFAAAPAASADRLGDKQPATLEAEIAALPWTTYSEGDEGYTVRAVQHLLAGAADYAPGDDGYDGVYDADVTAAVTGYQDSNDIPDSGDVDTETWAELRDWYGEAGPGSSGHKVSAAQSMLVEHGYLEESQIDGIYGSNTTEAVKAFQADTCDSEGQCLESDGWVGPLTFRALATGGI